MLNVLLADDEYLVRVMLKNCVDWNEMGFRIIGEVDKGDQILPACQAMHPDLLLLDINMPRISGLDALEQLRSHGLSVYVIIISGYSEFEYAKRGIRYSAFDYVKGPLPDHGKPGSCPLKNPSPPHGVRAVISFGKT